MLLTTMRLGSQYAGSAGETIPRVPPYFGFSAPGAVVTGWVVVCPEDVVVTVDEVVVVVVEGELQAVTSRIPATMEQNNSNAGLFAMSVGLPFLFCPCPRWSSFAVRNAKEVVVTG